MIFLSVFFICTSLVTAGTKDKHRVFVVQGRQALDPANALKVNLQPGKHRIRLGKGEIFYGKDFQGSTSLAVRLHDHETAVDRLYALSLSHGESPVIAVEMKRGGFLQAFIVDDYTGDNHGSLTLMIDDTSHKVNSSNALNPTKAYKIEAHKDAYIYQFIGELKFGKGFPGIRECFVRKHNSYYKSISYYVIKADGIGKGGIKFNNDSLWFFVVDETPGDNSGSLSIGLFSTE